MHVGQRTVVEVDTFPFTIYGTLSGRVAAVARDAVNAARTAGGVAHRIARRERHEDESFSNRADTERSGPCLPGHRGSGEPGGWHQLIALSPGMTVTVECETARHQVIDYLLSPLERTASEAFARAAKHAMTLKCMPLPSPGQLSASGSVIS